MNEFRAKELTVKVIAFDGQFLEIAVENDNGYPLNICRLQNIVCQDQRKSSEKKYLIAL